MNLDQKTFKINHDEFTYTKRLASSSYLHPLKIEKLDQKDLSQLSLT